MSHHQPTDSEIRNRVMAIEDEHYRHAFMYQLLICGRISEVCGKYAPHGTDVIETKFTVETKKKIELDGKQVTVIETKEEPAFLFIVKTAKRKGKLRPCAIPYNPEYEPWAKEIYEYFKKCGDDYPFMFSTNKAHSVRYAQFEAEKAFNGLEWPMIEYTRSNDVPYTEDMVLTKRFGDTGYEQYLVRLPDDTRYWTYDKEIVKRSEKVLGRWKPFRSHALRKRRTNTLRWIYAFDQYDLATYGGWTESSRVDNMPAAMKHYLHMDISSSEEGIIILKQMAEQYFGKLCIPYGGT